MAANASGNPQLQNLEELHTLALQQPIGPYQAPGTTMGTAPAQALLTQPYANTYGGGTSSATIQKSDGTAVPNPYGLTTEQIYWALSGHPDAIRRLAESLGAAGGQTMQNGQLTMTPQNQLFHQIVNYYESGGGGFNGGGYTAADAAKAAQNYAQGMGETTFAPQQWLAGMPVYANMAAATAGGVAGPGATAAGNGTNVAGYATGQGTNLSALSSTAPPPATNATPGATGGATGTTPGTRLGTTDGAGTTGNSGNATSPASYWTGPDVGGIGWTPPTYAPYKAPERTEDASKPFDFYNDEGYQFRLKEGQDAIQNQAAARGGLMSGNTLKALSNYASGLASSEYGAAYDRYNTNRNFGESQFLNDRNFDRGVYTGDRSFDYGVATDTRDFAENQRRDTRNFDYSAFMNDRDFNEGTRRWDLGFNYNAATGDRDFNEGVRRYDLGFNYGTANADRTFDAGLLQSLAGMGLTGTNSSGNLAATLAAILGQNTLTGAGAGAAGTVGQANTTNNFISQLLAYLNANNMLGQIPGGTTP